MTNVIKTVKRTIGIKNVFLHSAPCYRELIKQGSLCIRRAGRHTVICCQTKRWSYSKKKLIRGQLMLKITLTYE